MWSKNTQRWVCAIFLTFLEIKTGSVAFLTVMDSLQFIGLICLLEITHLIPKQGRSALCMVAHLSWAKVLSWLAVPFSPFFSLKKSVEMVMSVFFFTHSSDSPWSKWLTGRKTNSRRYNCDGWLGIKDQVTLYKNVEMVLSVFCLWADYVSFFSLSILPLFIMPGVNKKMHRNKTTAVDVLGLWLTADLLSL